MNNFDKFWRRAKKSIFRLERRAEYWAPGDRDIFKQWGQGKLDLSSSKEWQKWLKLLKDAKTEGIDVVRARVASKPASDFIKFQLDLWQKYTGKSGEKLVFLDEADYLKIIAESRFETKDFWLFDDEILLIFNYNKSGQFDGEILITNGAMIQRYVDLKQKLLQKAVSAEAFAK